MDFDLVIRLVGTHPGKGREMPEDQVISDAFMEAHVAAGRGLVRWGYYTDFIFEEKPALLNTYLKRIAVWREDDSPFANILIAGSSSGGRNAKTLAERLTAIGENLAFVGIVDGAFFHQDTANAPEFASQSDENNEMRRPRNVPEIVVNRITAKRKVSYFQTHGNKCLKRFMGSMIWTSRLGGEIHGSLQGFEPVDLTSKIVEANSKTAQKYHEEVSGMAWPMASGEIRRILEGAR